MARWEHMEESDRICNCDRIPGEHPAHFMCGCGMGEQCEYEAKVGAPLLHPGQRGYDRASAMIQGTGKRAGKAARREVHGGTFRALWSMVVGMGMYSQDPQISHPAMLIKGQQLIRNHEAAAAERHETDMAFQLALAQQQQAAEEERMRAMARVMAQEMVAEVRRQQEGSRS